MSEFPRVYFSLSIKRWTTHSRSLSLSLSSSLKRPDEKSRRWVSSWRINQSNAKRKRREALDFRRLPDIGMSGNLGLANIPGIAGGGGELNGSRLRGWSVSCSERFTSILVAGPGWTRKLRSRLPCISVKCREADSRKGSRWWLEGVPRWDPAAAHSGISSSRPFKLGPIIDPRPNFLFSPVDREIESIWF